MDHPWRGAALLVVCAAACHSSGSRPTTVDAGVLPIDALASIDVTGAADVVLAPDIGADVVIRDVSMRDVAEVVDASAPVDAGPYPMPPPVEPARMGWTPVDGGAWVAASTVGVQLVYDRTVRSPEVVFARCSSLVRYCARQPGRGLDDCIADAPRCATATPWMEDRDCCPSACAARFNALRAAGRDRLAAFLDVFADHPDCFPGLADGGAP